MRRTPLEPLRDSELRVLRYLYAKLGTHRRAETVARARDLGLLAPSAHQR